MRAGILERPALEPISREEHGLVSADRSDLVEQHLDVFALDRAHVVFAFNQDEELDPELRETSRHVDSILAVAGLDELLSFDSELRKGGAKIDEYLGNEPLECGAVDPRSSVTPRRYSHCSFSQTTSRPRGGAYPTRLDPVAPLAIL